MTPSLASKETHNRMRRPTGVNRATSRKLFVGCGESARTVVACVVIACVVVWFAYGAIRHIQFGTAVAPYFSTLSLGVLVPVAAIIASRGHDLLFCQVEVSSLSSVFPYAETVTFSIMVDQPSLLVLPLAVAHGRTIQNSRLRCRVRCEMGNDLLPTANSRLCTGEFRGKAC